MAEPVVCSISYRRSRFSTKLPDDRLYTPSHFWLKEVRPGTWRVGVTRFAQRMLGDLVEFGFEVKPGAAVEVGETVGWIEAFKATTDVFCVGTGAFDGENALLVETRAQHRRKIEYLGAGIFAHLGREIIGLGPVFEFVVVAEIDFAQAACFRPAAAEILPAGERDRGRSAARAAGIVRELVRQFVGRRAEFEVPDFKLRRTLLSMRRAGKCGKCEQVHKSCSQPDEPS